MLKNRIKQEPFNLVATLIFIVAILHTFMASKFLAVAHKWEKAHAKKIKAGQVEPYAIHLGARFFHFFGEVEVVFAGVSIPKKYFASGIGAGGIFRGALVPIAIMLLIFLMLR